MNEADDTNNDESNSLERSSSFESDEQKEKKNKVAFKTSYPSDDLDQNFPRRETPNTELKDFPRDILSDKNIKPDLSFYCNECEFYANLTELNDHKQFHAALKVLNLKSLPKSENELREHRKLMIDSAFNRYLKKQDDFETNNANLWSHKVHQINNAYEIVMSHVDNSFEQTRQKKANKLTMDFYGDSFLAINDSILAVGSCENQNKTHRQRMEDTNIILDKFGENENFTYFGVFDGYDGEVASRRAASQLHLAVLFSLSELNTEVQFLKERYVYDEINHLEKYSNSEEPNFKNEILADLKDLTEEEINQKKIHHSFTYAYRQMDKLLSRGKDETSKVRWSGATACACIIEHKRNNNEGWIHISNCGDVEAIVVIRDESKNKNYKLLTRLHTLNAYPKDKDRIEKNNGRIVETSLGMKKLEGIYSVTRGLGFHGDKNIKKFISFQPSVRSYKIEENFVALIIATKGLWNFLSYKNAADIIFESLPLKSLPVDPPASPSIKALLEQVNNENSNLSTDEMEKMSFKSQNKFNNDLRKKTGNLIGSYRNFKQNIRNISSTPADYKLYGSYPLTDDDDQFYSVNRPKTAPHEIIKFETKKIRHKKSSFKKKKDDEPVIKTYSNSDIYPIRKTNVVMNEHHDFKLDINHIKDLASNDLRLQLNDGSADKENELTETEKFKINFKSIQVNEFDIKNYLRDNMEDRESALYLEASQTIVERLVTSALLAGSNDNITVNCVLFSGSDL